MAGGLSSGVPRWAAILAVVVFVGLLGLAGFRIVNRAQGRPDTPAALEQTQAAERPGDAPSGAQETQEDTGRPAPAPAGASQPRVDEDP